jgi:hypothetical protein
MDKNIVERINASGFKFYFALTGGGTGFAGEYIAFGGASKSLIGAQIPYNQRAFDKFIRGNKVEKYASEEGARKLAVASFYECLDAGVEIEKAIGVGASCSVASTLPEREGRKHKIHIAFHTYRNTYVANMTLNQGRTRAQEEQFVNYLIYRQLAWKTINVFPPDTGCVWIKPNEGEKFEEIAVGADDDLVNLVYRRNGVESIHNHPRIADDTVVVYSGSWNPLHDGHKAIKDTAEAILQHPVIMEFSVNNTDKGLVDYIDIDNRKQNIKNYLSILTAAPHFRTKTEVLKKAFPDKKIVFIVGYDTWQRIWDAKYCKDNNPALEENIFFSADVKFLVFGRGEPFKPLEGLFGECVRIKDPRAEEFCMDISSSAIRKAQNK